MKYVLAVLALLVPAVYGQGVKIAAPAANSHVTATQSVVVEVERPVRLCFNRLSSEILKLLSRTHKPRLRMLPSSYPDARLWLLGGSAMHNMSGSMSIECAD